MRNLCLASLLTISSLTATDYGFLGYYFVDQDNPVHVAGRYRTIDTAEMKHKRNGHLQYSDGYAAVFYTNFIDTENSLTWGVGYNYLGMDWNQNPVFSQKNFSYGVASVGFVSSSIEKWRWIANLGATVELPDFNFGQTAVYHGMLWGRYAFAQTAGWHIGALGWYGILNGYALPIFGFDWRLNYHWSFSAIYPVDFSINYAFNDFWSLETAYSSFGGPYRYPRRASGGVGSFHDPIFEIYSKGVDLNLIFKLDHLMRIVLGGGWNFGGWVLIRDHDNHHGQYYHYNGAGYAQATAAFTF